MGARSYVPQLGRFLQPDPIPGGSANAYAYTFGDPVNTSDPSGALTYGFSGWLKAANDQEAKEVAEREVARETLEREEAERRAREAKEAEEAAAAAAAIPAAAEEPLGGYAGWEEEYALETGQYEVTVYGGGTNANAAKVYGCSEHDHVKHCPSNGGGEQCLVYFASASQKIKTCQEVLERYREETHADNQEAKEWLNVIECAAKQGFCPDG
jgi:uncharacterized protein RhaS with RHS repeats